MSGGWGGGGGGRVDSVKDIGRNRYGILGCTVTTVHCNVLILTAYAKRVNYFFFFNPGPDPQ